MKTIAKKGLEQYGPWAFIAGMVIAVILALPFIPVGTWAIWVLGLLGLVVGFLNISEKETQPFLLATIAWILAAGTLIPVLVKLPMVGMFLKRFLENVVTFVGPAAAVVAVMALYYITKD